ncbi:hypothetical protein GCM10010218_15670 [Streptomyces mashuensis]|uniref:Uncharacterized protein n=1 Tax=Streptomyces mashuensis TaxID=33904 RepID=A0A919AZX7_9ACTN|nr:hypothetical protein [Streptomyces mashuensis]GHF35311.1 hypothetical protein GCM10010218_15670 [Streptomyces mashuensis]
MSEFLMVAVPGVLAYLREVVDEMVRLFGISRAEAVARVNDVWGHLSFTESPDLIEHEMPEYWAERIYYADYPPTTVQPAPSLDSGCWTVGGTSS